MRFVRERKGSISKKLVWICFCPIPIIAIIVIIFSLLSPALYRAKATAQQIACRDNLRRLGNVLELYANNHHGKMPTGITSGEIIEDLNEEYGNYLNAQILICPGNSIDDIALHDPEGVSYYIDPDMPQERDPMRAVAADRAPWQINHDGEGVNVLFEDGHVIFVRPEDSGPEDKISNPYIEEDTNIYADTGDPEKHAWIRWENETLNDERSDLEDESDGEIFSYVPFGSEIIVSVDIESLFGKSFFSEMVKKTFASEFALLRKLMDQKGIEEDLHELFGRMVLSGDPLSGNGSLVFQTALKQEKLEKILESLCSETELDYETTSIDGYELFGLVSENDTSTEIAITYLDANTVLVSPIEQIGSILEQIDSGKSLAESPLSEMDQVNRDSTLWGVYQPSDDSNGTGKVGNAIFQVDLSDPQQKGLTAHAEIENKSAEGAEEFYQVIRENVSRTLELFFEDIPQLSLKPSEILDFRLSEKVVEMEIVLDSESLEAVIQHVLTAEDIPPPEVGDLLIERVEVPEEDNAFTYFEAARETLYEPEESPGAWEYLDGQEIDEKVIRDIIDKNAEALKHIEQGVQRDICLAPDVFGLDVPSYLPYWRSMARVMAVKSRYYRLTGKFEKAAEMCVLLLRFSDLISEKPQGLVDYLVGMAVLGISLSETLEFARCPEMPEEKLRKISEALLNLNSLHKGLIYAYKMEFRTTSKTIDSLTEGRISQFAETPSMPGSLEPLKPSFYFFHPNRTKKMYAGFCRTVIDNVPQCLAEVKPYDVKEELGFAERDVLDIRPNAIGIELLSMLTPAYDRVMQQKWRLETKIAATHLIIALNLYHQAEGEYPQTLEALVPEYIDEIPRDPYDCEPMRYNPEAALVYSVAKNLEDNGGNEPEDVVFMIKSSEKE